MHKCQIPKFLFDPIWTSTFQGTIVPQGDLQSKNFEERKVLRI
jgi:hypothetical protein